MNDSAAGTEISFHAIGYGFLGGRVRATVWTRAQSEFGPLARWRQREGFGYLLSYLFRIVWGSKTPEAGWVQPKSSC